MHTRSGNFDLMRLAAAFMVLWSHQFAMTGFSEKPIPYVETFGGLGVLIFFAISGYLNTQSIVRSRSAVTFLTSRALRIFPALIVCVAFCVPLGAIVTTATIGDYLAPATGLFGRNAPFSFLWRNSTLLFGLDFNLPGVFEANVYPRAVNGSLWTLPHEVKLYLLLALIAACCRFRSTIMTALVMAGLIGLFLFGLAKPLGANLMGRYFLIFAIIFVAGAALALMQQRFGLRLAIAILALLALGFFLSGHGYVGCLLAVAVACVLLNQVPLPQWLSPKLDISYGVYLYAFPIQQLTSTWSDSFWIRLMIVIAIVTGLALISARWIEQPALRLRRRSA